MAHEQLQCDCRMTQTGIMYCALHGAAPMLLEACEEWLAIWLYIRKNYPGVELPFSIRNGADACGRLRAAVAAAKELR